MSDILVVSLVFPPDNVSTAQIMGELSIDLKNYNHNITVISTIPHYNRRIEIENSQPIKKKWGKLLYKSQFNGITVYHIWIPQKGKNILIRIFGWIFFHFMSLAVGLTIIPRPKIIFSPSPPLTIGIVSWLLGSIYKIPSIYNVQEIYPDIAIRLGVLKNKFIIKLFFILEKFVYSKASAITVIAKGMKKQLLGKNVNEDKIYIIPNFVDVTDLREVAGINPFSKKHNIHNKFVISYAGNIGPAQGLECFIEAAIILKNKKEVMFLMMGDGILRKSFADKISLLSLENFILLPYQPYSLMNQVYSSSNLCLVPQASNTSLEAIPSKVYRIMACSRPVLALTDPDSDLGSLVGKSGCGLIVKPGLDKDLAETILVASSKQEECKQMGARGREYVKSHYSRKKITREYHDLIQHLKS